jgi:hypothetical protein
MSMLARRLGSVWQNRWTPWLLLIALVVLAGSALWVFLDYQRAVQAMAIESEYQTTRLRAARIREELANFPNALVVLARSSDIVSQDPDLQIAALRQAAPIREGLFDGGIVLLNNFGNVIAVEPPRPEILQRDWSDRPYFRELLRTSPASVVFSDAVGDGRDGEEVIAVSVPVIDGEGHFVGALAGLLRLSQTTISPYYATLVKLRVNSDGDAYVIDRSGRILFDSASLRHGEQYETHPKPRFGEPDGAEAVRTIDANGREILVSHAPIPGTPWTLVIEREWESLVAPIKWQVDLLLALLGLGVILPVAGLSVLARQHNSGNYRDEPIPSESQLARHLERTFLPEQTPILPGWEIAVQREPSAVMGRVFYDVLIGDDGHLTLIMGEMGRANKLTKSSVAGAMMMLTARTLLRSAARSLLAPADALERTNRLLCPDVTAGELVTCLYCRLDPSSGAMTVANADQVRPLKFSRGSVETVGGQGPPLALEWASTYGEYESTLARGDCLLLYSSEVLEARNAEGERFGFARLEQALCTPSPEGSEPTSTVADAIRKFTGGEWASERDSILIVVERLRAGDVREQEQDA